MKLAIVSGGFDPVHIGHLKLFEIARSKADSLFVILNNDKFLEHAKVFNNYYGSLRKHVDNYLIKVMRFYLT